MAWSTGSGVVAIVGEAGVPAGLGFRRYVGGAGVLGLLLRVGVSRAKQGHLVIFLDNLNNSPASRIDVD